MSAASEGNSEASAGRGGPDGTVEANRSSPDGIVDAGRTRLWRRTRLIEDLGPHLDDARAILEEIRRRPRLDYPALRSILRRHPREGGAFYSKGLLVRLYQRLCDEGRMEADEELLRRLRTKPTRTLSGVAPVTVLTRPHPCPGECVFCPSEPGMPKSYLAGEPGAQRAAQHGFDPFAQVDGRLRALHGNGHPVDKVELLVLGGCWTSYPQEYQEWFLQRCFDALNGIGSASLEEAQERNQTAARRNTGLVIETRPDLITPEEVRRLRRLGVTKVQLGAQSLDDRVLQLNRRGHDVAATRRAMSRLRAAGFKLVLHWMPNLMGSTPEADLRDFARLWDDPGLRPDEIKIYPCALLPHSELQAHWRAGEYLPYPDEDLVELVASCKALVPPWCRINRVHRDFPSTRILAGCRRSNLREDALRRMQARGLACRCIRCREVRDLSLQAAALSLQAESYQAGAGEEIFLSIRTTETEPAGGEGRLAGYLRLSLPQDPPDLEIPEISGAALIRELHIPGPALSLGIPPEGEAQHRGLGGRLLEEAARRAGEAGYPRLAVIASVGTREYYAARGYRRQGTYMVRNLRKSLPPAEL